MDTRPDQTKPAPGPDSPASRTLGEWVREDYRHAQVFKRYGLDFCCGGKQSLEAACRKKNISLELIEKELKAPGPASGDSHLHIGYWDPGFLADFIENNHHAYIWRSLQPLQSLAEKVARVHGGQYPELPRIQNLFQELARELAPHLEREERFLFPYIRDLQRQARSDGQEYSLAKDLLKEPLNIMEVEHEHSGRLMSEIRDLSKDYSLPAGACTSYTLLYQWLEEFEDDLHQHIHLENNILFIKARELEYPIR